MAGIWHNAEKDGQFRRQTASFRETVASQEQVPGRWLLVANYLCPWANRTLITRKLKKLESVIAVTILHPVLTEEGWIYNGEEGSDKADPVNGFTKVRQFYTQSDPDYNKRFTIPILYDKYEKRIRNNESSEIIRILNEWQGASGPDLYPLPLRSDIDSLNEWIYSDLNNGVYKAGFASTQEAYEEHAWIVFRALDRVEGILKDRDYLVGGGRGQLTEADVRLFTTIARFDISYHYVFSCNLYKISDYPHLTRWFLSLLERDEFSSVTKPRSIKMGYAASSSAARHILPIGPAQPYGEITSRL